MKMRLVSVSRAVAIVLLTIIDGSGMSASAAAPKAPPRRNATMRATARTPVKTAALTPASYAAKVSSIASCADFENAIWLTDEATPLLRRMFANPVATKSEFETSDAYALRLVTALNAKLGDMGRIYTIVPVSEGNASYDADRGLMTIKYGDYYSEKVPLTEKLDSWGDTERSYTASNSFGVKRLVKSYSGYELRGQFRFQKGDLPTKLEVPMSAMEAYRFKNHNGWLHVLASLDGYSTELQHLEATISDPVEVITYYRDVTLIPRCAVLTSGSTTIESWHFDRWSAE